MKATSRNFGFILLIWMFTLVAGLACSRSILTNSEPDWKVPGGRTYEITPTTTPFSLLLPTRMPGAPIHTPTPDFPHNLPKLRMDPEQHVVQAGDTLGQIADLYGVSIEQITKANKLANPNVLEVGQLLEIPVPTPEGIGPDFKIIPDSELVYGPASVYFDLPGYIRTQNGYLNQYHEKIDDEKKLTGAEIVQLVAQNYSVNPRLLLAILEYQSQWVTHKNPDKTTYDYPIGWKESSRAGLYRQLAWAANTLNQGFYLWRVNGVVTWIVGDGRVVPVAPTINAGTAGIQQMFAQLDNYQQWIKSISPEGIFDVYNRLFGYSFDYAIEPLIPPELKQPALQLPFENNATWTYTGGPHAGWDSGSAWAALDFAPGKEALGCITSEAWVVAVGDGLITRSGDGAVIQDLNDPSSMLSDGFEETGWVILYLHIADQDRVEKGKYVRAGERIGHPSCEGGISTGTHLHLARRYNGEWIPADQNQPFILDGWISIGSGVEYEGYLELGDKKIKADADESAKNNIIQRQTNFDG